MGFFRGNIKEEGGFEPSTLYQWLFKNQSGNIINGLGEKEARRPTPILWHNLHRIQFKGIQLLFKFKFRPRIILFHNDITRRFIRLKIQKRLLKRKKPFHSQTHLSPEAFSSLLKNTSLELGVDEFGITKLKEEWIFEGYHLPKWAAKAIKEDRLYLILFAVQHDHTCFNKAPHWDFSKEIANQYNRGSDIAVDLAKFILDKGYHAYGHGGPEAGEFLLTPAAIEAGLGELGKHGSLINLKMGSNFRIGCVYTTMPLAVDTPKVFGVDDFCSKCQICTKACPPLAISEEKQMVRGVKKFYVDFDKCMPYMTDNFGCGICLKVCPWSNENIAKNLAMKYEKKQAKKVINS